MSAHETRSEDRCERLLDAAFTAFMTTGYVKTSMSDIAKEAGVSRPTLYRSFSTKEAIFRSVAERLHTQTHRACLDAAAVSQTGSKRLVTLATTKLLAHMDIVTGSPHGQTLLEENQRIAGDLAASSKDWFHATLAATIADSDDIELAHGHTPETAARLISTLVDGWERRLLDRHNQVPRNWRHQIDVDIGVVVSGLSKSG